MSAGRPHQQIIEALVPALRDHVLDAGLDLLDLARDPAGTIALTGEAEVVYVDPNDLPKDCSIAACYDPSTTPPRLLIARDLSPGRRAFSALHEYTHHLCQHVSAVADAFWELPDGGKELEERLADEFASRILIPEVVRQQAFADGVTAAAVVDLWRSGHASREAVCVAAATHLPAPGYVMLLHQDMKAQFTARHGDALPIARDTRQTGARLAQAARAGKSRGVDRPRFPSNVLGQELYLDAVMADGYIFAVWVQDSPSWPALPVALDGGPQGSKGYCESCDREFQSWAAPCSTCGDHRCTHCNNCSCDPGDRVIALIQERRCDRCFLLLPLREFTGNSTTCNEH